MGLRKTILLSVSLLLLVFLTGCASTTGNSVDNTDAGSSENKVEIRGFAFEPGTLTVKAGTTVTWTNLDSSTHTVDSDNGDWASGDLSINETYSKTFDEPGTYAYHCGIHPEMTGVIEVTQ